MLPAAELDQIILSFCSEHWQKVARIVGKTYEVLEERGIPIGGNTADEVDKRLAALVAGGQLVAQGNIKRWRYSEVRLPGGEAASVARLERSESRDRRTS